MAVIESTTDSQAPAPATAPPGPGDIQPVANETRDRVITGAVTVIPFLAVGAVGWLAWESVLHWSDVIVFAVFYVLTGLGITVGFHRHLTHRAFKTTRWVRGVFAALGSAAIEGPVIAWVADHRKHHAFTDVPGDPHSPHVDHGVGLRGALRGLLHAHVGWLFIHTQRGNKERYAPDLISDPTIRFIDRTFVLWVVIGLAAPFVLGFAIGGSVITGLTGMLWGGLVRVFLLHHVTYSINSLCHFFGRRRFATGDESRNLLWLAPLSFGESWHNNHHAFPTSAHHGMRLWEVDPSALVILGLEKTGLAWDVVRIGPERQRRKAI
jgi:stearoyl-CoA desaturase (delta-9 desaturase)